MDATAQCEDEQATWILPGLPAAMAGGLSRSAQAALAAANQHVMETLEDKAFEAERGLAMAERTKEELGVALFGEKQQNNVLRARLEAAEAHVANLQRENENLASKSTQARIRQQEEARKCTALEREKEKLMSQAIKNREHVEAMRETCRALKLGLKSQKMSDAVSQRELELLQSQLDRAQAESKEYASRLERALEEKADALKQVTLQEHETKVAQRRLEKVVEEMQIVNASKVVVQNQWQAALVAMSQRDKVLVEVQKRCKEAEGALEAQLAATKGSEGSVSDLRNNLAKERARREESEEQSNKLQEQLAVALERARALAKEKRVHARAEDKAAAEADEAKLQMSGVASRLDEAQCAHRKAETNYADAVKKIETLNQEIRLLRRDAAKALEEDQQVLNAAGKANERTKVQADNKVNHATLQVIELQERIRKLEADLLQTEARAKEAEHGRGELESKVVHLEMQTLRQGNKINKMLDQLATSKAGQSQGASTSGPDAETASGKAHTEGIGGISLESRLVGQLRARLATAERERRIQRKELETLRLQWSRAESNCIKATAKVAELMPQAKARNNQVVLLSNLQAKAGDEQAALRKQHDSLAVEIDTVRVKQRKANEAKGRLLLANQELEARIDDADIRLHASKLGYDTEVAALRSTLAKATRANKDIVRSHLDTEANRMVLRSRYELLAKEHEICKERLETSQRECAKLQVQLNRSRSENSKLKKDIKTSQQAHEKAIARGGGARPRGRQERPGSRASLASGVAEAHRLEGAIRKAESALASSEVERVRLESALEAERSRAERIGKAFLEREALAEGLSAALENSKEAMAASMQRCERAVGVARALEAQLQRTFADLDDDAPSHECFISYEPLLDGQISAELDQALETGGPGAATAQEGAVRYTARASAIQRAVPRRPEGSRAEARSREGERPASITRRTTPVEADPNSGNEAG